MRSLDPVALLDAIYEPTDGVEAWLQRAAAALAEVLDEEGGGYGAYYMGVDGVLRSMRWSEGRMTRGEFERALAAAAQFAGRCDSESYVRSVQTALGLNEAFEMTRRTVGGYDEMASSAFPSWLVSAPYVAAPDGEGGLLTFGFHRATPFEPPPRLETAFRRIAIHLGAGYRLARQRAREAVSEFDWMLDDRGKVVHSVIDDAARESLREAAVEIWKAKGSEHEADRLRALETWQGLFVGRWSLVDHFGDDGRHYVVAIENGPESPGMQQLTAPQRRVMFYASLGWSNAEIGYALGSSASTVATHLSRGLEACGIANRGQLVAMSTALAMSVIRARAASS